MPGICWAIIKDQKISIGALVIALFAVYYLYGWLGANFVTKVEAAQYNHQVTEKVEEVTAQLAGNTQILNDLVKTVEVGGAFDWVESSDAKVYRMENGGASAMTLRDAKKELTRATKYRDCLLNNQPNCKLLKRYD